jgi:hypothetical protein
MQSAQSSVAISPHRPAIAALFNLEDAAERFMVETLQRFHCEHPGLYTAHALKRVLNARQERVVVEVASFQPQRRQARAQWMLILWNIDKISIRFQAQPSRQAAFASYQAMVGAAARQQSVGSPLIADLS